MASPVPIVILTTPSPTKKIHPLCVPTTAYPASAGAGACRSSMSTPSPGTSPASSTASVLLAPASAASSVSVPAAPLFENYSTFCSHCRIVRREHKHSTQDALAPAVAQEGPVDIGHWDDDGNTTPSHKRNWAGRLLTRINARSEKIKGTGVMSNAVAAQSFATLEEVVSISGCEECGIDSDGGKAPELPKCIDNGEPGAAENAVVSGTMQEGKESTGIIPVFLDRSTGAGNIHDGKCGAALMLEAGAGESEAGGQGLSIDEQRRLEELEGGSEMVFFGRFVEGEEWAFVPLAVQE